VSRLFKIFLLVALSFFTSLSANDSLLVGMPKDGGLGEDITLTENITASDIIVSGYQVTVGGQTATIPVLIKGGDGKVFSASSSGVVEGGGGVNFAYDEWLRDDSKSRVLPPDELSGGQVTFVVGIKGSGGGKGTELSVSFNGEMTLWMYASSECALQTNKGVRSRSMLGLKSVLWKVSFSMYGI